MIGDKSHLFFQSLLVIGHCGSVTHKQQSVPWGVSLPPSDELDNGKTELVNKDEHVAKNKKRGDLLVAQCLRLSTSTAWVRSSDGESDPTCCN